MIGAHGSSKYNLQVIFNLSTNHTHENRSCPTHTSQSIPLSPALFCTTFNATSAGCDFRGGEVTVVAWWRAQFPPFRENSTIWLVANFVRGEQRTTDGLYFSKPNNLLTPPECYSLPRPKWFATVLGRVDFGHFFCCRSQFCQFLPLVFRNLRDILRL